jgi:hypothetical protein
MLRSILITLLLCSPLSAHSPVFKLLGPDGQGSGVVVHKVKPTEGGTLSLAATAQHVICRSDGETVNTEPVFIAEFANGLKAKRCSYAAQDKPHDLALIWVICPDDIPHADIAATSQLLPEINADLNPSGEITAEFIGYGHGSLRINLGKASFRHKGIIQSDATLMGGQSGGGMFIGNRLAGIISGGNEWYKTPPKPVTWPARCADAELIPGLIQQALGTINK